MLIRAVEVTSYRVLRHVRVDLARGLNVIHGENDTGKSTLMNAIRDVLTRRAKVGGGTQRAMLPRDGSTPEIAIDFEQDGALYTVRKRFAAAKGTARVTARFPDGRTLDVSGDDAEAALRTALGLGPADTSARKRDDTPGGIWPLLWIDQGTSNFAPQLNDDTRLALSDRLSSISGAVLAGAGAESLFFAARAEYRRHFTDTGKQATGVDATLFAAQQRLAQASAERDAFSARLRDHEATVDRHAALAREVEKLSALLPDLDRAAAVAEKRAQETRAQGDKLLAASAEAQAASIVADLGASRLEARAAARAQLAVEEAQRAILRAKVVDAQGVVLRHDAARVELEAVERDAVTDLASRDRAYAVARADKDATAARRALRESEAAWTKAKEQHDALVATRARLATLSGAEATARAVAEHERAVERAELELEAAAASIEIRALGGAPIEVDGSALDLANGDTATRRADAPMTVCVPGVVEIRVTPGGKDLARTRAGAEASRTALRRSLDDAGARDVAEVRARVEDKRRLEGELATKEQLLALLAPNGIDALETTRARDVALLATSEAALASLGTARAVATDDGAAEAQIRLEAAERARDDARATHDTARARLAEHDLARQHHEGDARVARQRAQSTEQRVDELTATIARSVAELGDDATLRESNAREATERDAKVRAAEAIAADLAKLAPDDATSTAERTRRAHEGAVTELREKSAETNVLFGELRSADLFGLHERLGAAASRVDEEQTDVLRITERAESAKLLFETLSECRSSAQRAFVQPLQREITPLLQALFSDGEVSLDDSFRIDKLTRTTHGIDEFDALGGGAREQLAILVRLGMASVLAGEGTLPVLLDDAIVFSSEERFDRMTNVLMRVARRLQIVLFTCHWERYRTLGVDRAIDLAALLRSNGSAR